MGIASVARRSHSLAYSILPSSSSSSSSSSRVAGPSASSRQILATAFSTDTQDKPEATEAAAKTASDEIDISFLDPNNPPELTDEQVDRLSEQGWSRVKAVYPDDFRTMMENVAMEGTPDYSELQDLTSAFTKSEPVPYYVTDKIERNNIYVKNPCILCDHFQVKMCENLNKIEYTNIVLLNKFINERGMINSMRVNGTCPKAQRHMAWLIKRGRQVGLISYLERWQPPITFMQKMKWFQTDIKVEAREYNSKRKGKVV